MKPLAIGVVAPLVLILALLLAACDDGGAPSESVPTRSPPADAAARFQELSELKNAAAFHVIYELDTGSDIEEHEFAWLQDAKRMRWDDISIPSRGTLVGTMTIDDGAGSGITCDWATLDGKTARIVCSPGARAGNLWYMDEALNGYFRNPPDLMEFRGYGSVLGTATECFGVATTYLAGHICLSSEGVPLEIDSSVGSYRANRYSLAAIDIRSPPSEAELLTPVIPEARLGVNWEELGFPSSETPSAGHITGREDEVWKDIAVVDLVLPDMPIIEDFFSEVEK